MQKFTFSVRLLCLLLAAASARAAEPLRQEYFVRQEPGEALLIRINPVEADFRARVYSPEQQVLADASLPGSSLAPLFLYVARSDESRQLDIGLEAGQHTNRTRFLPEYSRLAVHDDRGAMLLRAYQALTQGLETAESLSPADWVVKIGGLNSASGVFDGLGMEALRQWSDYYAAFLVLHRLGDLNQALDAVETLQASLRGRQQDIALATALLHCEVLAALREAGELAAAEPDPLQAAVSSTVRLAVSQGQLFAQAQALAIGAADHARRGGNADALRMYQEALAIADRIEAAEFATAVREQVVKIHGQQGDIAASGEVLRQIEKQLTGGSAEDQLAQNLLAQGRLFNRTFQFAEAIGVLEQALGIERNSMTRAQAQVELARARLAEGQPELAAALARVVARDPASGEFRGANPALDMATALGVLADAARQLGNFEEMRAARAAQARIGSLPAGAVLYWQGLDAIAQAGRRTAEAQALMGRAYTAARPGSSWRDLALLQACAGAAPAGLECGSADLQAAHARARRAGGPADPLTAAELRALWLARQGQSQQAVALLETALIDLHLLRQSLPGSLGAWYHEFAPELYRTYLGLRLAPGNADGSAALLALTRVRWAAGSTGPALLEDPEGLRRLLAQRLEAASAAAESSDQVERALAAGRSAWAQEYAFLSAAGLASWLARLEPEAGLLTLHLDGDTSVALLAVGGRVHLERLAGGLEARLAALDPEQPDAPGTRAALASLGRELLGPLAARLPKRLYFIAAGAALRLPLDALQLEGRYLLETREVAELRRFPSGAAPAARLQLQALNPVFVAGMPQDYSPEYMVDLASSGELRAVTDVFVGPGLHLVQGHALQPDEFQDPRFGASRLLHFALPAEIDLAVPAQSWLELSEADRGLGRTRLKPGDLSAWQLNASLATLSGTRLVHHPVQAWETRLGLVDELLEAGSAVVLATAWRGSDTATAAIAGEAYTRLRAGGDAVSALAEVRRNALRQKDDPAAGLPAWAAWRVFIE